MAISADLLEILCCPETKEDVHLISVADVDKVNAAIQQGKVRKRSGKPETETITGGLLRVDGKYLYPVREDIPIMLIDEAIDMSTVS